MVIRSAVYFIVSLLPNAFGVPLFRSDRDHRKRNHVCINPRLNLPLANKSTKPREELIIDDYHSKQCSMPDVESDFSQLGLHNVITAEQAREALVVKGSSDQWNCMLNKLAAGKQQVEIMILGGSVAAGHECSDDKGRTGLNCAWPARFEDHLRRLFPSGKLVMTNLAVGGTTTLALMSTIPMLLGKARYTLGKSDPDLIILDNLLNEMQASGSVEESGIHAEAFTRFVSKISPKSGLLFLEVAAKDEAAPNMTTSRVQEARQSVASFYNVPMVNTVRVQEMNPQFWQGSSHPSFTTHGYIADLLYVSLFPIFADVCKARRAPGSQCDWKQPIVAKTLLSMKELSAVPVCYTLNSSYSAQAEESNNVQNTGNWPGITQDGNWELCEDRPGKPGWMAARAPTDEKPAEITFRVKFGTFPTLALTILRSYNSLGTVELEIGGNKLTVDALYPADSPKVSQSEVMFFKRDLRKRGRWDPGFQCSKQTGCYLPKSIEPGSEHELTLRLLVDKTREVNKFKVLEVASC
eukprot:TRINITY_DN19447_c0_g3_i1.p1 TRINITY_DN19447_c0_g3~~TRINITY_DN19447_c0_g3_i1.p1  ORF type:complete len:523 (-),score=58.96 TRINITY_DN19447_c0_g3_i1:106-1674(-)